MELKKQGGKRRGAGRKPILNKKKQFSFYIEVEQVLKFGNEEKFKKSVTDFIYGYGKEVIAATPTLNAYDGAKTNMATQDEHIQWQEVKSPITGLPPKLSDFDKFSEELYAAKSRVEVEAIMRRSNGGVMFPREKNDLKAIADKVLEDMFND